MEQGRVDPLLPGDPVPNQIVIQADLRPDLKNLMRWDPRVRDAVLLEQLA